MSKFSACIEMLFVPESADPLERVRLAQAAGFEAVEFWLWSNKDLDGIERVLGETNPLHRVSALRHKQHFDTG